MSELVSPEEPEGLDLTDLSGAGGDADERLGLRIRQLRKARDLSLKDIAERSGFSISFLSQIERGKSSASVRVLVRIASALNVGMGNLFEEPSEPVQPTVQRREGRRKIEFRDTSISKELVSPPKPDSQLDVYLITIDPGGSTGGEPYVHPGQEAGLVLEGTLELTVDSHTYHLRDGDGFSFESRRPHRFSNPGSSLARVVWINARIPEEQR